MQQTENPELLLAAEDCAPAQFKKLHYFSTAEERLISKLIAHGPVLLRGGRGSGKSALMIEASNRLNLKAKNSAAIGLYVSLRHLELLRSQSSEYIHQFCKLLVAEIRRTLQGANLTFDAEHNISSIRDELTRLSSNAGKRIVLYFDDAAHIGREASLAEFFDIFRTLSGSSISCKAAIYPGVTKFGTRFDVFNDATVVDIGRTEDMADFAVYFDEVLDRRFGDSFDPGSFSRILSRGKVAEFLGSAVLGNMRSFVFACNLLSDTCEGRRIGYPDLGQTLIKLAQNYYWPLLEELQPKLGVYQSMVEPAREVGELLFGECGKKSKRYALVYRDLTERLAKPFEILEYAGFISKREISRSMKSGGRGARYALNLCNIFEQIQKPRFTQELYNSWQRYESTSVEFHTKSRLTLIELPEVSDGHDLEVLSLPVAKLAKSNAYPYGLTERKIAVLTQAGFATIGDLAQASDTELLRLRGIGSTFLKRIRNVVGQAIWM